MTTITIQKWIDLVWWREIEWVGKSTTKRTRYGNVAEWTYEYNVVCGYMLVCIDSVVCERYSFVNRKLVEREWAQQRHT